jgi:hypothetical protein
VTEFAFALLLLASILVAAFNWRLGIVFMIFVAVLQDPVRKMMPGAPAYMVLAFIPIWLAICINVFFPRFSAWRSFIRVFPWVASATNAFILALLFSFLVLLFKHGVGTILVGVIGGMTYLFPLLAMVVGFMFIRTQRDFDRLVFVYSIFTAVILTGGWLQYLNLAPEWKAVGTVVLGMDWIRHVPGYIVKLNSGFYRSPDLLGWHSAMLAMISLLMMSRVHGKIRRIFWIALFLWGMSTCLISGRNKMIFMPVIFLGVNALVYLYKADSRKLVTAVSMAAVGMLLLVGFTNVIKLDATYTNYLAHGSESAIERLDKSLGQTISGTVRQSGIFGEGLGSASVGARYGGGSFKTWQESGPGRLVVELGIPGFLIALSYAGAVLATMLVMLKHLSRSSAFFPYYAALIGLLAANGASFTVSHQLFGDPFVVVFIGLFVGIALSVPLWEQRQNAFENAPRSLAFKHQ